jgi:hypothetical protein
MLSHLDDDQLGRELTRTFAARAARIDNRPEPDTLARQARAARRRHRHRRAGGVAPVAGLALAAAVAVPRTAVPPERGAVDRAAVAAPAAGTTAALRPFTLAGYDVVADLPAGTETSPACIGTIRLNVVGTAPHPRVDLAVTRVPSARTSACLGAALVVTPTTVAVPAVAHPVAARGRQLQVFERPDGSVGAMLTATPVRLPAGITEVMRRSPVVVTIVAVSWGLTERQLADAVAAITTGTPTGPVPIIIPAIGTPAG